MTTAVLFPGQGSQHDDMRWAVERDAPELLDRVCELMGEDPFERLDGGTLYVQPAVYCASVASWRRANDGLEQAIVCGHSLGEIAALVAADALDCLDGLRLVVMRARSCSETTRGTGGMMAIGADVVEAREIAALAGAHVANDNAPAQTVLSGTEEALATVEEIAEERALRKLRLAVEGPFHSPLMAPALARFEAELETVEFSEPRCTVLSGITAEPFENPRRQLLDSLVNPVRWRELLLELDRRGVTGYVEAAPGKALSGLVRRTLGDVSRSRLDPGPQPATPERLKAS